MAWIRSALRALVKPRGDGRWDILLRGTALIALIGIPVLIYLRDSSPMVLFALLSVPANSPLSPILPTAFEPLIMEAAKHGPAWLVALIGTAVYMYMEYLNYHLYAWVLRRERLARFKEKRWVARSVEWFARAPFLTIVVFAFAPFPFWVARILSIYRGYPMPRFMLATVVGRLPRIYVYAWLGAALAVPTVALAALALGTAAIVVSWRLARGKKLIEDAVLDLPAG